MDMKLIYLLIIPVIFIGVILFISNASIRLRVRLLATDIKDLTSQLEENKLIIPYTLRTVYKDIVESKLNIIPSNLTIKHWVENSEIKKEKEELSLKEYIVSLLKRQTIFYSIIIYIIILIIWMRFDGKDLGMQFLTLNNLSNDILLLGLDGLTLPFILLIGFIFPICYLSNWTTIEVWDIYYLISILAIEYFLIMVFIVIDFTCFYIFFESILPPLFLLIGVYGAAQRFRAGYYLFLYTLFGSLFMLVSFMKMGGEVASTFFDSIPLEDLYQILETILWLVLFLSFSVKTPLVPFHIWLPLAHSDANVSGSIILASVVLKLALYGFLRVLIGILVMSTVSCNPLVLAMCGISILYSSFTTMRQFDLKVLVAYSSVAHMGSTLLGTFSDNLYGLVGSILFGLAHGFVSPGLFILVGAFLYDRVGTRFINYYRGLTNILPIFALLFLLFIFGNMGVPLTGNFIGEFLSLLGAYQKNIFIAIIGTTSVILSAGYSIFLYNRVASGSLSPYIKTIPDMFRKEFYLLAPLLFLTILLGIYPYFITSEIEFSMSSFLLFAFSPITFSNSNLHSNFTLCINNMKAKIKKEKNNSVNLTMNPKSTLTISNKLSKLNITNTIWSLNIGFFSIDSLNNIPYQNKYGFLFTCILILLSLVYLFNKYKYLILGYYLYYASVIKKYIKYLFMFRWLILTIISISYVLSPYIFNTYSELNLIIDYISSTSNFNTLIAFFSDNFNVYMMRNYMLTGDPFFDYPSINQKANNILFSLQDNNPVDNNQGNSGNIQHTMQNNVNNNNGNNTNRGERMDIDSDSNSINNRSRSERMDIDTRSREGSIEKEIDPQSNYIDDKKIHVIQRVGMLEEFSQLWREALKGLKRKLELDSDNESVKSDDSEKTKAVKQVIKNTLTEREEKLAEANYYIKEIKKETMSNLLYYKIQFNLYSVGGFISKEAETRLEEILKNTQEREAEYEHLIKIKKEITKDVNKYQAVSNAINESREVSNKRAKYK